MQTNKTTKEIGNFGERMAVRYLRLHGYTVKERNWRSGHMEIEQGEKTTDPRNEFLS